MTIVSSGLISLQSLRDEFGGSGPIALGSHYRGGGIVPAAVSTNVPTTGQISLSNFYSVSNTIQPAYSIGQYLWQDSRTGSPASGIGNWFSHTYVVPDLTVDFQVKYDWSITSTAAYGWTYARHYIFINGVNVYTGYIGGGPTNGGSDSWYRDYSGTRSGNTTVTLHAGDTIQTYTYVGTRGNEYTPIHTAMSANLQRVA